MRMNPNDRRELILDASTRIARKVGYQQLTRDAAAEAAGVAYGLINHYFETVQGLKAAIVERAVANRDLEVVAQAVIAKDPIIKKAPYDLKLQAFRHYLESSEG